MTGNVQLYLTEVGRALTRMAAPLDGFGGGVKVVTTHHTLLVLRVAAQFDAL